MNSISRLALLAFLVLFLGTATGEARAQAVTHQMTQTGGATGASSVATDAIVAGFDGHLYLAAIASKPPRTVSNVQGLGLAWTRVRTQCSGRNQTGIDIWVAKGNPSGSGLVSATFSGTTTNAAIAVSRYSNADSVSSAGAISGNTRGVNGACSGGVDSSSYAFNLTATIAGAMVYGAVTMWGKTHTPGAGYTERADRKQGASGSEASVAVEDKPILGPSTVLVNGSFSGAVDWAVIALEIKPGGPPPNAPDIAASPTSQDYGEVMVSTSASRTFTLRNDGTADLVVTGTTIAGTDAAAFAIVGGGAPFTLAPTLSANVEVRFMPPATGAQSGTLRIESNDADESPLGLALTGRGIAVPVADFTGTPISGSAPLAVNFTDRSTGAPSSWLWNFGDGSTAMAQHPQHTYASAGTYTVTLSASNTAGADEEVKTGYIVASAPAPLPGQVSATVETQPRGGNQDDPAIWIHPGDPSMSLVLGTFKAAGIGVYNLDGTQQQFVSADGGMNNVDLRYNFLLGGELVDLVIATNRDSTHNSFAIYKVNPVTRQLVNVRARTFPVGIGEVYGACMYRSPFSGKYYAIITDKVGMVEQWELFDNGLGKVDAVAVRRFAVGTQSEGCVTDDQFGHLYIGEERRGIWKYGAEPAAGTARTLVDATGSGGHLSADVEGLTIYYASDGTGYLIASSQGNSAFAVYRREGSNEFVMTFRIVAGNGIDAVTSTDGIDVTNFPLDPRFPLGLFVAHDNVNEVSRSFKLVPWDAIANATSPALTIDTFHDPRQ